MIGYVWLVPLFPLLGVFVNGLLGKKLGHKVVGVFGSTMVGLSFGIAVWILMDFLKLPVETRADMKPNIIYTWIVSGGFQVNVSFLVDSLSTVMMLVVTGVGFLIHVYSIGYMHGDRGFNRFFAYLNLFTFSMLLLILADNFLLMFVGWEGVGLCSYLLIGFWYEVDYNAYAGRKAFVVNRVGDYGFCLALFLIFAVFGSLNFDSVFLHAAAGGGAWVITAITLLLFVGATGKSAQIPLYVWLPDAMAGPTPVSALIHAATMVTAGVYMVARCNVLFRLAPVSMAVVAVIGAATAIFAASIALTNTDIKRVLAYSTISQLGYMFLALGVGAFAAGIFHLMTHAFFKALLFLAAGSVMHALAGETDMRKMGSLRRHLPATYWTMLMGTLAIAGIPLFSGFFSKDEILWQSFISPQGHFLLWLVGVLAAGMTAFYMFRLIFLTFFGESRMEPEVEKHVHESPRVMTVPLTILAVLSVIGGYIGLPHVFGGSRFERFLEPVLGERGAQTAHDAAEAAHGAEAHAAETVHHGSAGLELTFMAISVIVALVGIWIAYMLYLKNPDAPGKLARKLRGLYKLSYNKYYMDEIYNATVVQPIKNTSDFFLWRFFDVGIIDGIVNGVAALMQYVSGKLRRLQSGLVQNYAFFMLLGVVIILGYFIFR